MKVLLKYSEIKYHKELKKITGKYCSKYVKIYILIDEEYYIKFRSTDKKIANKYIKNLKKEGVKFHEVILGKGNTLTDIIERNYIDTVITGDNELLSIYRDNKFVRCIDIKLNEDYIYDCIDTILKNDAKPIKEINEYTTCPSHDKVWLKHYNFQAKREYERLCKNGKTIFETICENNRDFLYETAIIYYGVKITYESLIKNVEKMTKMLIGEGVKKDDVVSICTPNVPEGIYCYFAAQEIGAIPSMLHVYSSPEDMKYYFQAEKTKLVIAIGIDRTCKNIMSVLDETSIEKVLVIPMTSSLNWSSREAILTKLGIAVMMLMERKKSKTFFKIQPDTCFENINECCKRHCLVEIIRQTNEIATIIHTGGTTGRGKSVLLTHNNILSNDAAFEATIQDFERQDTILAIPPLFHVLGLNNCIILMLKAGGKVVFVPKYNKYKIPMLVKKYHPEMIFGVPKIGKDILDNKGFDDVDMSHLKYYVLGGEEMSLEFIELSNKFLEVHRAEILCSQSLGATECSCSMTNTFENGYVAGSIGIPLINMDVKIIKYENGKCIECSYGDYGEICFSGPSVMKGYLADNVDNSNCLKIHEDGKEWFHTGDVGYINREGVLFFVDRTKDLIKINGEQVFPSNIKRVIMKHRAVKDCAVIGTFDSKGHKRIIAVVVLSDKIKNTEDEIRNELFSICNKFLIREAIPQNIEFRNKLPETNLYKINHNELRKEYS